MKRIIIAISLFITAGLTAAPYIWMDKTSKNNFNITFSWPITNGRKSIALKPDRPLPPDPYFEYEFSCETAGEYVIWGRTFDPNWSSPGRWKVDEGEWQEWQPGPRVNRQVHDKTNPLDWCRWGSIQLGAGTHTLRFEPTGKRKRGDYYYFLQDALLLTPDAHYKPAGGESPLQSAEKLNAEIAAKAATIEDTAARNQFLARAEDAMKIARADLDGIVRLKNILSDMDGKKDLPDDGRQPLLNGRVENVSVDNGTVAFKVVFNAPWSGNYLLFFTRDEVLYHAAKMSAAIESRELSATCPLPAGLPAGTISLYVIPLNVKSVVPTPKAFENAAGSNARAMSWGIYRDSTMVNHPWYVTASNVMIWDGEPYIPFGGMINTRLSWGAKAGDDENTGHMQHGEKLLAEKLDVIRKYGLNDVFYNGVFSRSNPNLLRKIVNTSEEKGIRYGIHLSSIPDYFDTGFSRETNRQVKLAPGTDQVTIDPKTAFAEGQKPKTPPEIKLPYRALWLVLNDKGELSEYGMAESSESGSFDVKLKKKTGNGFELAYLLEQPISGNDPVGYLSGLDGYLRKVKSLYGSAKYGPGFRFFIDPLRNEMHARPVAIPTNGAFRNKYEHFLQQRYGSLNALNQGWKSNLPDLKTAARLIPLWNGAAKTVWVDPEDMKQYISTAENFQSLRDFKEFRGELCRNIINQVSDTLKSIADVPVILKHNTWFSDWFVNPQEKGGFDSVGMESYCYGDSLAYHNSAVVQAEVMQGGRTMWSLVTESSAAAFEGQKDYCGYLDRFQMLDDIDQMMMFGAKGFYHFGFSFDPDGGRFFTTDLLRDPRQLEWMAAMKKLYDAAGKRFLDYQPEYYGWYPAYLREREIIAGKNRPFDMDGNYMGTTAQIRMAPDGRWIVPALNPNAGWKKLLAAYPLMTQLQQEQLKKTDDIISLKNNLNSFTANGIGVITPEPGNPSLLEAFRRNNLGYTTFQTEDINGIALEDGTLMVWTCVERQSAAVKLPPGASAKNLQDKELPIVDNTLTLTRPEYVQLKKDLPSYLPNGYHYIDHGQPEFAVVKGAELAELLKLNKPYYHRWLPEGVGPEKILAFKEAEDFTATTFTQPSLVGYSRYSGGRAIGINTHFAPPENQHYQTEYQIDLPKGSDQAVFRLRRMTTPSMALEIYADGKLCGEIAADAKTESDYHLSPWNAGLSKNRLTVGWNTVPVGKLSAGSHKIVIRAKGRSPGFKMDTQLMGGDAESNTGVWNTDAGMRAVQLDCFMITE